MLRKAFWWDNIRTEWKMQWASKLCWYLCVGGVEGGGPVQRPWVRSPTTVVQFSHSVMSDSATPWTAARQASLSITNSELAQTHVHRVADVIQPSHPLLYPSPPAFNLSQHQGLLQRASVTESEWLKAECSRNCRGGKGQYQEWPSWPW